MDMNAILAFLKTSGIKLLYGIIVLTVGFFLIHWVLKLIGRSRKQLKIDPTVRSFLSHLIRLVLYILVILLAVDVMGIPMTSIVTIMATAGAAFSLAMQGALGNLIGGFFLLVLKPIRVGEYVKLGSYEGTVKSVGSFYTNLLTFDGLHVSLPNGELANSSIVNYTREGRRRMELLFSVSYDSNVRDAMETLRLVTLDEKRLLEDPAPSILLKSLSNSSIDIAIRAWTRNEDYWDVYYGLMLRVKEALDKSGISIPYPQMDVHIKPEKEEIISHSDAAGKNGAELEKT